MCENGVKDCRDIVAEMLLNVAGMGIAYVGICRTVVIVVMAAINLRV